MTTATAATIRNGTRSFIQYGVWYVSEGRISEMVNNVYLGSREKKNYTGKKRQEEYASNAAQRTYIDEYSSAFEWQNGYAVESLQ